MVVLTMSSSVFAMVRSWMPFSVFGGAAPDALALPLPHGTGSGNGVRGVVEVRRTALAAPSRSRSLEGSFVSLLFRWISIGGS